jgi:plasmid stability protein
LADFVLRNLDDDLIEKLRQSAAQNGRSMSAELQDIVRAGLSQPRRVSASELKKLAAEIRKLSDENQQTPCEELLREGRNE